MKTKKWAIIFLLFVGIILFAAQSALGGCEIAALDALVAEGNAPGTKLEGPLTVFYYGNTNGIGTASMYFFMRLRKGSDFYSFAGGPYLVTLPTDFTNLVPDYIEDFFINVVVPNLNECDLNYNPANPPSYDCQDPPYTVCAQCPELPDIVLKSYDMDVDWEAPGNNGGLVYFITNIQVGIHD
jgi:hypothetical protein